MKKYIAMLFLLVGCSVHSQKEQRQIAVITQTMDIRQDGYEYILWTGITETNQYIGGLKTVEWWNHGKTLYVTGDIILAKVSGDDNGWVIEKKLTSR